MSLEAHHQFIINTMMRHDDIARKLIHELEVENALLKTDAQVILKHLDDASADCARLKAEVERLRKAGDAMAETLEGAGFDSANDFWNAAKEGKPHA